MRRDDVYEILRRMPAQDLPAVVFVLRNGAALSLDAVARLEAEYLVFRGREGGTTEEGRAFFLPYEEVSYLKYDREGTLNDIKRLYGEESGPVAELTFAGPDPVAVLPAPAAAQDPAAIARQNLLDRIRAARTSAGGPASRGPGR